MRIQDEQLLCLQVKITIEVEVLPIIYSVLGINHFINFVLTKILLHLLPLGLPVDKDAQHIRSCCLHKMENMDDSPLN